MIKSFAIFILLLGNISFANELAGVPAITDGDTLKLHGEKIRLDGIDAPESAQICLTSINKPYPCGQNATLFLKSMTGENLLRTMIGIGIINQLIIVGSAEVFKLDNMQN